MPTDIRCYVVNLRRRPDRRAAIAKQIPGDLPVRYTSDWPVEIDGRVLDHRSLGASGLRLFPWRIESANPWWSRPLKWGEIGCAVAHIECWRAAVAEDVDYALILEDDAVMTSDFVDDLRGAIRRGGNPSPFDLLYLGRYPLEPDAPSEYPGLVIPGYSHCTFGYVLSRRALRAVIAARLHHGIVPVDEFLPALYQQHPRHDLRRRFPPQLRALAFDPPLATQRPKAEAGSDTEASEFVEANEHG
ncbi:MAG: glycosyltransferase family 25 protein [Cryobacterium sp.]|nr:glycosyltransferase family 25 protein [Cryobacterium sp.]